MKLSLTPLNVRPYIGKSGYLLKMDIKKSWKELAVIFMRTITKVKKNLRFKKWVLDLYQIYLKETNEPIRQIWRNWFWRVTKEIVFWRELILAGNVKNQFWWIAKIPNF